MACTSCVDKAGARTAPPATTPAEGDGSRDLELLRLRLRLLRPSAACSPPSCRKLGMDGAAEYDPCLPRFPLPRLSAEPSESSPLLLWPFASGPLGSSDRPRLSMRRQCQMRVMERERNAFGGCPRLSRSPTKRLPALAISLDPREKICAIPRGDRDARNFALSECLRVGSRQLSHTHQTYNLPVFRLHIPSPHPGRAPRPAGIAPGRFRGRPDHLEEVPDRL